MIAQSELERCVTRAAQRHEIPGISVAIACGPQTRAAAYGVANLQTQIPVTADTLFQIGSITKVFTGTLVMQFVDAGAIELDLPIRRYLPDLAIAGAPISDAITVRMLLTHTSGISGDCFLDTGRNDDATQRYVEHCSELEYVSEPGSFSYCNSGYVVLGRLIEVLCGRPWIEHLKAKLLTPLGMPALTDAEDAALYRVAAGHIRRGTGEIELTPLPYLPRSTEAAGSRLSMSAHTLLTFARMHLRDGLADDGSRVLSERSAREMRELEIGLPFTFHGNTAYGLAWALRGAMQPLGIGHNGGTIGQSAFLLLVPDWELAIAVLTNVTSGGAPKAFDEIARAVLDAIGPNRWPAEPPIDESIRVPVTALAGRYETYMEAIVIAGDDDGLHASVSRSKSAEFTGVPDHHYRLHPIDATSFVTIDRIDNGRGVAGFTALAAGVPRYLFWGGRLAQRVAG